MSEFRAALERLEAKGAIRSFWEIAPESFVVAMERGPNLKVRTRRDLDGLEATVIRKAAVH